MSKIAFTLVSPSKSLYSADADMVIIPAKSGDIGVMAGHSPLIGTVRAGTIIVRNDNQETRLFVETGFVEVNAKSVIILVEQGILVDDIDKKQAQDLLNQAVNEFNNSSSENKPDLKAKLDVAKARLRAVEDPFYK